MRGRCVSGEKRVKKLPSKENSSFYVLKVNLQGKTEPCFTSSNTRSHTQQSHFPLIILTTKLPEAHHEQCHQFHCTARKTSTQTRRKKKNRVLSLLEAEPGIPDGWLGLRHFWCFLFSQSWETLWHWRRRPGEGLCNSVALFLSRRPRVPLAACLWLLIRPRTGSVVFLSSPAATTPCAKV